jgi:hypothetical protein
MRCRATTLATLFASVVLHVVAFGQQMLAPDPQPARIAGTVTDSNGNVIPGATITVGTPTQASRSVVSNDTGFFQVDNLTPGTGYRVTVSAKGFVDWKSGEVVLSPGQVDILKNIKLAILGGSTSVTVVATREELAVEQVRIAEHQRVLGVIPNFYVSYDKDSVPLTPKLKFRLALRVSVDPVTFAATGFLAAMNQANDYPDFQQGWKGYGQRFGAVYANDLTDILVGGAILPSVLHQDPRYFYQGTGTTKSRWWHAISNPIICKGDNGQLQPNYSSLGGYLASGALANAYYPQSNRGVGLVFRSFGIDFGASVMNGILQEFVLRKLTPSAKNRN